jgi:hypothetical protein
MAGAMRAWSREAADEHRLRPVRDPTMVPATHASPFAGGGLTHGDVLRLQRTAGNRAVGRMLTTPQPRAIGRRVLARNPRVGKYVVDKAIRWVAGRGATISKHVAKHIRHIAGKAVHSVFRSPNQVKKLVETALKQPDRVVAQAGRRARWVVEKEFNREIGRNGERILRIVVESSGRIVTAFPVRAFTTGTAAALAYLAVDDAVAHANARLDRVNKQAAKRLDDEEDSFLGGLVKTIVTFGLYSGNLNAGEGVGRWVAPQVKQIRADAIAQAIAATDGLSFEEEDDDDLLPMDPVGGLLKAGRIAALVDASLGIDDVIAQD